MNKAKNQTHKDLICGEFSTSHSTPQMCGEWPFHCDPKVADQVKCACSTRVHTLKGLATECKPALAVWLTEENTWVFEAELSEETTWFFPWGDPTQELLSSHGTLWGPWGGWSGWNPQLVPVEEKGRGPGQKPRSGGPHRVCGPLLRLPRGSQARGHLGASPVYEFPHVAATNYQSLVGLKQQKLILSQFWRPEVWNQDVGKVGSFWRLWGRVSSVPLPSHWWLPAVFGVPWLIALCPQSLLPSLRGLSAFLCLKSPPPFSYKDTSHWI